MKKKIYPHSLIYVITIILYLVILVLSIYANLMCWYKIKTPNDIILMIPILATLFSMIMFSLGLIDLLPNKLIFNEDGLLVTGQKFKGKIQYKEYIHYSDIVDVRLICAHIDSRGYTIKNRGIASMRPHRFFECIIADKKSKFLHIEIYSIKQRKQILEIISQMTNQNFSYDKLEKLDQSIFRRKNK